MKIVVEVRKDQDGNITEEMFIDEESKEYVGPLCECPEDAIIGRSLVSCRTIVEYMKLSYEAGRNGESVTFETRNHERRITTVA